MLNLFPRIRVMDSRIRMGLDLVTSFLLLLLPSPTIADPIPQPIPVLELRQATTTNDPSQPTSSNTSSRGHESMAAEDDTHVFNYYFLLIAIFIAILLLGFIFAGRRRKRKTQLMIQSRQQALRRDLEGWQGGPRPTRNNTGTRWGAGTRNWRAGGVTRHDEGLDELGEAPPPYNPGDKPPSIVVDRSASRSHDGDMNNDNEGPALAVPLRTLSRNNTGNPPGYLESIGNNGSDESAPVARPDAAVTPNTDRFDSSRRLLDSSH